MKKVSQKTAKRIVGQIDNLNNKFKNAYFFSSPVSASSRRSYEKFNSIKDEFYFIKDKKRTEIHIDFQVTCSCKNVYVNKLFKVNDKSCNILKLRNISKRL